MRAGLFVLTCWCAVALCADLIASDLPIAISLDGETFVLPALTRPEALQHQTQATLRGRAAWMLGTLVPFGPTQTVVTSGLVRPEPPPWSPDDRHWLGTDEIGRDVLARLVHGARLTLLIALGVVLLSTLLGVALGALAGWKGGVADLLVSRALEVASTFPTVFFLIVIVAALRTPSVTAVIVVLALTRWPEAARLMRAEVLRLKDRDFVVAARALGAGELWLLGRHVVPNALPPIVVSATFAVGSAVLLESALSFLGLGAAPPAPSWGELLQQAHRSLVTPDAWWLALFPGLAIASLVLATQAVGRGLARRFDARP
ncbi:MAG: ABC transporter permease [Myxococcaceae bacterium]|nr:ABC transporter permease [Myxococcaceae bacterium]